MRNRNWPMQLGDTIKAAIERPFSWGEFDCAAFAADCCMAVCGVDPLAAVRGKYSTEAGAKRVLKKHFGSLEAACDAFFERVSAAMAQRGDLCIYAAPEGQALAVLWTDGWYGPTDNGVRRCQCEPLTCWRVDNVKGR